MCSIRWRTIEIVLNAGYADTFRRLHPGDEGLTFPVWAPHVRLDYIFAPADRAPVTVVGLGLGGILTGAIIGLWEAMEALVAGD